jgi:prephenate dehydrogenase
MSNVETFGIVGSGQFAKTAAKHFAPEGAEVLVYDQNERAELPKGTYKASFPDVAASDVIVLSVPFDAYRFVLPELAVQTRDDGLIVDVCSVKMKPHQEFKAHGLLNREEVLMSHPLFGPQTTNGSIDGRNIVVTQVHGEKATDLLGLWNSKGANMLPMSPREHDMEMAKVHVLPFFIGRTLLDLGITESKLGTNYFDKLVALVDVERLHSQELYETIQRHNPFADSTRIEFIAELCLKHLEVSQEYESAPDVDDPNEIIQGHRRTLDLTIEPLIDVVYGLRFAITRKIGAVKAEHGMEGFDPEREKQLDIQAAASAEKLGIDPDYFVRQKRLTRAQVVLEHAEIKQRLAE